MDTLKAVGWAFIIGINAFLLTHQLPAQSIPDTPSDIDFGGVTVHLNEQGRLKLRQQIAQLYADRAGLQRDIESLRQLTPLLEPLLRNAQLPMDYRYAVLPFTNDLSAGGYWGLTPNRAQALKIGVSNTIDEQYHPIVATEAVVAHLRGLQAKSNNYVLTLLRYLESDTLADRPTQVVDTTYLVLNEQSPLLLWKTIARKLVYEREEPTLHAAQTYLLYIYRQGVGHSLREISQQLQLDEGRLQPFNAWLKAGTVPDKKEYPVLIRVTADEFPVVKSRAEGRWRPTIVTHTDVGFPVLTKLARSAVITYESAVFYTINDRLGVQAQPCDNVITLAHYGKITIETLLSYNELSAHDVVLPGHIYYLERKARRAKVPFHVVTKNQTLHEIADVYGVRLKSLLHFNRFQPTQRVQQGRIVWLQKKRPRHQPVEYRQIPVDDSIPMIRETPITAPSVPVDSLLSKISSLPNYIATNANKEAPVEFSPPAKKLPDTIAVEKVRPYVNPVGKRKEEPKLHVVRPKQTYYSISRYYGITLKQLYNWNKLSESIPLRIGQKLIVELTTKRSLVSPPSKNTTVANAQPTPTTLVPPSPPKPIEHIIYHVVKAGQTVYRVALINKVSVPDLMRWNNLTNYTIEIGQKLLIRKPK